ncbi:hypothetical protein BDV18DRAFT_166520 [Aspergillus unguis]
MSLMDIYQRFLTAPSTASLASDVSLYYITTTTELNGADKVIKHLTKQQDIKIKSQTIIDSVQGSNALSLDVDTSLQFLTGGGAYLPNLDETFLFDRDARFPTIHIVRFNAQNEIQSIRIHWDQATLLKQVEVIGSRSRNWPIRDADKQIRLIKNATSSAPADNGPPPAAKSEPSFPATEGPSEAPGGSPGKKHIKDPYAAESLFDLLSPSKDREQPVQAPRAAASAAPPPRDYNELFVGDEENGDAPDATPSRARAVAPKVGAGKNYRPSRIFEPEEVEASPIAPKVGAGKNFARSRIFDDDETVAREKPDQIAYRAHPKRFEHFELGADNSSREVRPTASRAGSRHVNQWDFEDFSTPQKPQRKPRGEEIRHFGWSDDEPEDSPPTKPRVLQPRRDAETHFQIADGEEQGNKRIIKSFGNKGLSLYKDTIYGGADEPEAEEEAKQQPSTERPLSVVHNGPNRQKDFESHWDVTDEPQEPEHAISHENKKPSGDRLKAVKSMQSSWAYDKSPGPASPLKPGRRMLQNVNQKHWGFDDEE